jgi:hypothetical protein
MATSNTSESAEPEPITISDPASDGPESKKVTLAEKQEDARRALAIILVLIFAGEVLGAMLALWTSNSPPINDIKEILTMILGPTVALVGSAMGFYFGTRPRTDDATD